MEEKNKLYVGNLPYEIDDDKLRELFAAVEGVEVVEASVIVDKFNGGRSKGFGFVTVADEKMSDAAIKELNGKEIEGRQIFVNVARPKVERPKRDFGGRSYN